MEKIDMIYDLLGEVREEQKTHGESITSIQSTLERNTQDVEHHIKRTDLLEEQVSAVESRVDTIEKPGKIRKAISAKVTKWVLGIGALSGSIFVTVRLVLFFI